ncbi:MAG: phosphoribosyltransferase family protein [Chitinophagaceae bacterium]
MTIDKKYILNKSVTEQKMKRMAYEILEDNGMHQEIILAGIKSNGFILAINIARLLEEISGAKIPVLGLSLDKRSPKEVIIDGNTDINGKVLIIVDDVSNSGKTLTYALKPFLDQYPSKIQTLVLVQRSHKKFPVHPDYVGISLSTFLHEHISVEVLDEQIIGAYVS